ncbi:MAG: ThuA domain-containing protein [Verrucomicrobiota bacterium]
MNKKSALIIEGGWKGHEPKEAAQLFAEALESKGFAVEIASDLAVFDDVNLLRRQSLIIPCWTMGNLTETQAKNLSSTIQSGIGLGGFHGGMGDAFRGCHDYEWMVGGHFVGHPFVGEYIVRLTEQNHTITSELPKEFSYNSEQYYMLMDPGNTVLAETTYLYENHPCSMPVIWIKSWGSGRVFYSALGHKVVEFSTYPKVKEMTIRGLLWAAKESE